MPTKEYIEKKKNSVYIGIHFPDRNIYMDFRAKLFKEENNVSMGDKISEWIFQYMKGEID